MMQNHSPPSLKRNYVGIVMDTLNRVWVSRYRPTIPHIQYGANHAMTIILNYGIIVRRRLVPIVP